MTKNYLLYLMLILPLLLPGCGVKLDEDRAQALMDQVYKARKQGSITRELRYYAKDDFEIVDYDEVRDSLIHIMARTGSVKSIKPLKSKIQNRNQLGKGMVKYLLLSYEVTYENMTLLETYYFLANSEEPKLVYMTLQL